jgi:hypothetical protein
LARPPPARKEAQSGTSFSERGSGLPRIPGLECLSRRTSNQKKKGVPRPKKNSPAEQIGQLQLRKLKALMTLEEESPLEGECQF